MHDGHQGIMAKLLERAAIGCGAEHCPRHRQGPSRDQAGGPTPEVGRGGRPGPFAQALKDFELRFPNLEAWSALQMGRLWMGDRMILRYGDIIQSALVEDEGVSV